jgi:ABC-2 type transport system ATP-binding protein
MAIRTERLRKQFGLAAAVEGVTFEVPDGQNFALLGPNGAGKSTLIRLLTTLIAPTSGRAEVAGHDVQRAPDAVRRAIGVIPQAYTSDPGLTAAENLHFYGRLYGMRVARRTAMVDELLATVGLEEFRDKLVGTFSGGMRRRLEIARSLMHEPRILFLDEPTTGLDPVSRLHMWDMIRRLKLRTGVTLFLTTHYMEEADELCDRIAIFDHGKVVAEGTPAQLKARLGATGTIAVEFASPPAGWADVVRRLPGVQAVEAADGRWRIESRDRMETVGALVAQARRSSVPLLSLVAEGRTLEDVFIAFTGRDLRDQAGGKPHMDVRHLYERGHA